MEKEWEITIFSDFVWTEILWLLLFVGTLWFFAWLSVAENNPFFWLYFSIIAYYTIRKAIFLFRTVRYRRKNPVYFRVLGQTLHYSLPEMGQGQMDVRQLDLLQYNVNSYKILSIPLRDGSGCLKVVQQHFQAPFIYQDYLDWCKALLADLEKAQWDNQQPFHSFLNKEIQS